MNLRLISTIALVLALAVLASAQHAAFLDSERFSPLLDEIAGLGGSYVPLATLSSRYARDILDTAVTSQNCNETSCGNGWVVQTWNGANCLGTSSNFSLFHNPSDPVCTQQNTTQNTSRLLVCDTTHNFIGAWTISGSSSCDPKYKDFLTGYRLGACINANLTVPSMSTYSIAIWCNIKDALAKRPSLTTPYTSGPSIPTTSPCPNNNGTNCDMLPYSLHWTDSNVCLGQESYTNRSNISVETCYSYSFPIGETNASINFKMDCHREGYLLLGLYGRGCEETAASFVAAYNTSNCLTSNGKSYRYYCDYYEPSGADPRRGITTSLVWICIAIWALLTVRMHS